MKRCFRPALILSSLIMPMVCACSTSDATTLSDEPLARAGEVSKSESDFETVPADDSEEYEVVFEDEFEGTSRIPDETKWSLCPKGTANWARYLSESYDQAYQEGGYLYLIGEKIDDEYKTAGIETRDKFDFEYGKVECRARFLKMPQGNHTGIWMMPAPPVLQWPKSGEIDIMEHLNKDDIIYQTVHSWYADDMGHKEDPVCQKEVSVNKDEWNTYGLIWTPESITYTVNGEAYLSYPNLHLEGETGAYQWPFSHPFYLILSQSLGGEGTWAGPIDDAELPAIFQIDWIKVSQLKGDSTGINPVYPD